MTGRGTHKWDNRVTPLSQKMSPPWTCFTPLRHRKEEAPSLPRKIGEVGVSAKHPCVSPVFTENISRVQFAWHMCERQNFSCDSFTDAMVGQCVVAFVQAGVWDASASYNRFVVSEHVRLALQRYSKVSERQ